MSNQQFINTGSTANDNTGDPLRTAFVKTEDNFNDIYSQIQKKFPYTASAAEVTQVVGENGADTVFGVTGSLSVTNAVSASIVKTGGVIEFTGGNNNKIVFDTESIDIYVDNARYINIDGGNNKLIINPDSQDIDTLIYGTNGSFPVLTVNAGLDRVGINTQAPSKDFTVSGELRANRYFGDDLPTSDPGVSGQFFVTSSEYFNGPPPYINVLCVSLG